MTMKYNILGYLIGEGFSNVFKNTKSTIAALTIMCATMVIFGVFLALTQNINHFVDQVKQDQAFQVFIENGTSEEEVKEIGERIRALSDVNTIDFISREQGLNTLRERLGDSQGALDGVSPDILPDSYLVTVTELERSQEVQAQILEWENIRRITSVDETITTLINFSNGIRIATGFVLVTLIVISVFIISNTIKLTVHARRKEISIMKYVGATNGFIRWPFIYEGFILGTIGSLSAFGVIWALYNAVAGRVVNFEGGLITLIPFEGTLIVQMLTAFVAVGFCVGVGGSGFALNKYLKV